MTRKWRLLFLVLILIPLIVTAQSGWYHLTSPGNFATVFFVDSLNGWLGGTNGISRTTDGGASWNSQTLPVTGGISRIVFLSSTIGLAVGSDGAILKTTNSGSTWIQKESGTNRGLSSINFLDSQHGWACGIDTVLLTTDQGETWSARYVSAIALWDISFRNSQEGWVVGLYEGCYKSTDGGNSWNSVGAPISGRSLFGICFPSPSTGVIIGGEQIARTTNGGTTWSSVYNSGSSQLNSVSFADSLNGWVVGTDKIVKTTDGGSTWKEQSWPSPYGYLTAVHSPDKKHSYAVGDQILLKTVDGGGVTSVHSSNAIIPDDVLLYQNYPNPFNPSTVINYKLAISCFVSLKVYNELGRKVQTLINEHQNSGEHSIVLNANNLTSGVYFYRLSAGSFVATKKLLFLK
jgi:photosystem II stability/assembly factor-like uncharacterized protein